MGTAQLVFAGDRTSTHDRKWRHRKSHDFFLYFSPVFSRTIFSRTFFPVLFSRTFSRTFFFSYFFFVLFPVLFFRDFFSFFFPYYFTVLFQTLRRLKSNVLKYQWVVFLVSRHLRPIIQSETKKKNQSEEGYLPLPPRPNNIYSDKIINGILSLTDHNDVHLREMRQRIYREEQPDQTSIDPCSFLTNLFLWGMRQGVQSTRPQKKAWSGPQLQLDLRVCGQYFNRLDILARHRAQHERPEAKQRLPMKRPAAPEPGPIPKQRRTVLLPRTPMGNPVGPDVLPMDPETRA